MPPGFVCFAQRYKHPGQYSFRTCFVWRNKHAGGVLLAVCFARTNKQARIPRVSLVYLHKHSQYPVYANANAHAGILFALPFGLKRTQPITKVAYVTILLGYILHAHISNQANVHYAEHSSVSVYLTLSIFEFRALSRQPASSIRFSLNWHGVSTCHYRLEKWRERHCE